VGWVELWASPTNKLGKLNRQDAKFAEEEEERVRGKTFKHNQLKENFLSNFLFSISLFFLLRELGVLAVQFFDF
jgi:hypothetical protein